MIGEAICPAHGLEMNQLRYRTALGRVFICPECNAALSA